MMTKKVCVVGAGKAGMDMSFWLKKFYGEEIDVTLVEKMDRTGGRLEVHPAGGHLSAYFLQRDIHEEEAEILQACAQDPANWKKEFCVDYDALPPAPEPAVEGRFNGTRWFTNGQELNAERIDAGIAVLKQWLMDVGQECLVGFDPFRLTNRDRAWDKASLAELLTTRRLPNFGREVPTEVSEEALKGFSILKGHDNGRAPENTNLLADMRLTHALGRKGGYYNSGVEVMLNGGAVALEAQERKLRSMGVNIVLGREAHVQSRKDPTVYYADGSSEKFDLVVFCGNPTQMDPCLADPRFTMGRSEFFKLVVDKSWAEQIGCADVNSDVFEGWWDFTPPSEDPILVCFGRLEELPWDALDMAYPGIREKTKAIHRSRMCSNYGGSFSCLDRGTIEVEAEFLRRADQDLVFACTEAMAIDFFGYPGGASYLSKMLASRLGARLF